MKRIHAHFLKMKVNDRVFVG